MFRVMWSPRTSSVLLGKHARSSLNNVTSTFQTTVGWRHHVTCAGSTSAWRFRRINNNNTNHSSITKVVNGPVFISPQHVGAMAHFSSRIPGGGGGGGANPWRRGASILGAGALVMASKGKAILGALKFTKFASLGSMLMTVGTYSMFFGWPYAAGMVGLIAVHEAGHALVMHQRGIDFSPAVFVPFMGAVIAMKDHPRDAWEDALIAFGGPVLGSVGAGAVAIAGHATDSQLLFALADFGFMVNLFNLMPIGSMDGGRIAGALSPWTHVAGLGLGGTLAFSGAIYNPIFYLILLASGYETFMRFYNPASIPPGYYKITPSQRGAVALGYAGLIGSLIVAMQVNEAYKKPPEVLIRERELEKTFEMRD